MPKAESGRGVEQTISCTQRTTSLDMHTLSKSYGFLEMIICFIVNSNLSGKLLSHPVPFSFCVKRCQCSDVNQRNMEVL